MVSVKYSERFLKRLDRLPERLVQKTQERENLFKHNPFHSILRTHKLHGKLKNEWAFWVDYRYRIKFIRTKIFAVAPFALVYKNPTIIQRGEEMIINTIDLRCR